MIVFFLIVSPFQPVIVVGITSGRAHRSPKLVSDEWDPTGSFTVIALTGTSGVSGKLVVVMPLVILVCPTRITRTPEPLRIRSRSGNASPPWETRIAGPVSLPGRTGVVALTPPTKEPEGHL